MAKYKWEKYRPTKPIVERSRIEVLHWGRRSGKTTEMVRRTRENSHGLLLTSNLSMADAVARMNPDIAGRVQSVGQYLSRDPSINIGAGRHTMRILPDLYIDEAGLLHNDLLDRLVRTERVQAVTLTHLNNGSDCLRDIVFGNGVYSHRNVPQEIQATVDSRDDVVRLRER